MPARSLPAQSTAEAVPPCERWSGPLTLFLAVLCLVACGAAVSSQSTFTENLGVSRRCIELNDCSSSSGPTGGLPIFHGAVWSRLLSYSLRSTADQSLAQSIVLALLALSVPLTFWMFRRYLGWRAALLALGLYFPVIVAGGDFAILTYTNLMPLPWVLYFASVGLFLESRRLIFTVLASAALAIAVSAETGSIVIVPFHLLLFMLIGERKLFTPVVAGLSVATIFTLESTDAALAILRQVPTLRFAAGVAIAATAAGVTLRMDRHGLIPPAAPLRERMRVVMTVAMIYSTFTIWVGCLLLNGAAPALRYLMPALVPFLYLLAGGLGSLTASSTLALAGLMATATALLARAPQALDVMQAPLLITLTLFSIGALIKEMRRRGADVSASTSVVTAAVIGALSVGAATAHIIVAAKRGVTHAFTLAEGEPLVHKIYAGGYTYPQVLGALHGPAADDLLSLFTQYDPGLFVDPPARLSRADFSLLVMKVPSALIQRTRGVVAALAIDETLSTLAVRDEPTYLDWTAARRCEWKARDGQEAYLCSAPRTDRPLPHNWPYVDLTDPIAAPMRVPREQLSGDSVYFEVPVRTPGNSRAHIVRTVDEWPSRWRIHSLDGVAVDGELPGMEIRLPDASTATGIAVFELVPLFPHDLPWVWLPHVIEVAQDNEHLLQPLRNRD